MNAKHLRIAAIAVIALGLSACADDPDENVVDVTDFAIRFIHASADAPPVNIELRGATRGLDVTALDFKQATNFRDLSLEGGSATVEVLAQVPGGTASVIPATPLTFDENTDYTVIAIGEADPGSMDPLAPLILANAQAPVTAGNVRVQVVHGAPNAPEVDVYVTGPTDDILPLDPLGTFQFGGDLGPVEVPADDYRIRVVVTGDMTKTPVFDSGTVALPAGADLVVVAVENTNVGAGNPGQSPISLAVAADPNIEPFEIVDVETLAAFRAAHFSPDTLPVNVLIDDDMMAPNLVELNNVPYPVVSNFIEAPGGTYNVKIELVSNPGAYAIDEDVTLEAGKRYSVSAADYTAGLIADGLFVLEDDFRPLATGAKVRIVHLAPGAGLVDIYVTPAGTGIAGATPGFAGVDFKDETGYVQLDAGMYDVDVTLAGTQTVAISATIDVAIGGVYTALARDAAGGGAPFDVELLVEL